MKAGHCLNVFCHNGLICLQCKMPDSFLFYIFEKQRKTAIVYVPTERTFHVSKNIKLFFSMF